jgi:hypothetical protein
MPAKYRQVTITGETPHNTVIGLRVRVRTHDYPKGLIGVVERVECTRPVVRFPDGRWAYGERRMQVLVDQGN